MSSKDTRLTYSLLIIFTGIILYFPSLFGGFLFDDEDFVYANSYVRSFKILKFFTENAIAGRGKLSNYYRPIQMSLYALINKLFGLSPFMFHLADVTLHITSALLAFYFLLRLTKKTKISFLASFIFLIHPIQTEAVSYISGLSDPLYTNFLFLALIYYLKFQDNHQIKNFFYTLIFFVISFLSKELGLVFLPLIVLIEIFFKKPGLKKRLIWISTFFIVGLSYLTARFTFLQFDNMEQVWIKIDKNYAISLLTRIYTFLNLFPNYIGLLFFPLKLHMERDYTVSIIKTLTHTAIFVILFNLITLSLLFLLKKKNHKFSLPLFFYLSFLATLSPFSGIFLVNGIFYEHYLYLPLLFFLGFVFSLLEKYFEKLITKVVFLVFIIFLILRSFLRQYEWIDAERFYKSTLKYAPKSVRILNNLGMVLSDKGKIDEAIVYYKKALEVAPKNPVIYHNLANAFVTKGDFEKAEKYYIKAINLNPKFLFSYAELLKLYNFTNQKEKAKKLLEKWKKINSY